MCLGAEEKSGHMKKLSHSHHVSLTKYIYKTANGDYVIRFVYNYCYSSNCIMSPKFYNFMYISRYLHIWSYNLIHCFLYRDAYPGTSFNAFGIRQCDTEAFIAECIMTTRDNLRIMKSSSDFNKNALTKLGKLFVVIAVSSDTRRCKKNDRYYLHGYCLIYERCLWLF